MTHFPPLTFPIQTCTYFWLSFARLQGNPAGRLKKWWYCVWGLFTAHVTRIMASTGGCDRRICCRKNWCVSSKFLVIFCAMSHRTVPVADLYKINIEPQCFSPSLCIFIQEWHVLQLFLDIWGLQILGGLQCPMMNVITSSAKPMTLHCCTQWCVVAASSINLLNAMQLKD